MSRTNAAAVKALLLPGKDYDTEENPSLEPFIETAGVVVDRVAACAVARSLPHTVGELEIIERWLAAHFYVASDQTYASKNTSGASASFHGQTGMYLESSRYGQTAVTLDYSGCLTTLSEQQASGRQVAGGFWLGKAPSEQTDYVDRD